jgi:hypothetical protein
LSVCEIFESIPILLTFVTCVGGSDKFLEFSLRTK